MLLPSVNICQGIEKIEDQECVDHKICRIAFRNLELHVSCVTFFVILVWNRVIYADVAANNFLPFTNNWILIFWTIKFILRNTLTCSFKEILSDNILIIDNRLLFVLACTTYQSGRSEWSVKHHKHKHKFQHMKNLFTKLGSYFSGVPVWQLSNIN